MCRTLPAETRLGSRNGCQATVSRRLEWWGELSGLGTSVPGLRDIDDSSSVQIAGRVSESRCCITAMFERPVNRAYLQDAGWTSPHIANRVRLITVEVLAHTCSAIAFSGTGCGALAGPLLDIWRRG